jgi:hypothetical protein
MAKRVRPIQPVKASAVKETRARSASEAGGARIRPIQPVKALAPRPVRPRAIAVKHSQAPSGG